MPCLSDYQNANEFEIENSKVLAILEELKSGKLPKWFGDGYNKRVYNCTSRESLDSNTAQLCTSLSKLAKSKLNKLSLEAQLWWRDHQAHDARRKVKERKDKLNEKAKQAALNKLSKKEKILLGLK